MLNPFRLMTEDVVFIDDASLWAAFQSGNRLAFEQLYRRHAGPLLTYGKRLITDHDRVADAVQDAFLDIWQRRATLTTPTSIRFYLFRIIRNRLVGSLTRSHDPLRQADDLEQVVNVLSTPSIETLLTQHDTEQQTQTRLRQAIESLPPRQREAITLAFYDQFSNEEIAQLMSINVQSAINHLNRGLGTLRNLLSNSLWIWWTLLTMPVKIFRFF